MISGFAISLENALVYYDKLTEKLVRQPYVVPENAFDPELILECQAVGDNSLQPQRTWAPTATFTGG